MLLSCSSTGKVPVDIFNVTNKTMKPTSGSIIIGVMILISIAFAMSRGESDPEPDRVGFVITWNETLCQQTKLANPGGLSFEIAQVCYIPDSGWQETKNTTRLQSAQYDSLIKPLYREIRDNARSLQLYDEGHNSSMYRMFMASGNRYGDRQ